MSFSNWLFGTMENPVTNGRWGILHIITMLICVALIVAFHFIVKHAKQKEKTRKIILSALVYSVLFFEIASRVVYIIKKFYLHTPDMEGLSMLWIIIPKPWCAISCWLLVASVFVNKKFFYNFAGLSALLCAVIFFSYPGVGFNNKYILFDNLYSICTHALLLTTAITMIVLRFTEFKYREIWKLGICFLLTFIYGLVQIYFLKTATDPMYFMPNGDIQAGILHISYGLYLFLYITFLLVYINAFYLVEDRKNVKEFICRLLSKRADKESNS